MYIDYQILSVVEDMSANPQSKFDGMNCTPIALGRYDDSSKILCLSATLPPFIQRQKIQHYCQKQRKSKD